MRRPKISCDAPWNGRSCTRMLTCIWAWSHREGSCYMVRPHLHYDHRRRSYRLIASFSPRPPTKLPDLNRQRPGPPGCSKTSLVKAAATSAGASFVALSAADLYSPLVGDAEAGVRRAFKLARASVPAILFFDEIDALVVDRGDGSGDGGGGGNSNSVEARVLSTFLNEMDGIRTVAADGVVVVAATNRPGTLDAALLRPGDPVHYHASPSFPPPCDATTPTPLTLTLRPLRALTHRPPRHRDPRPGAGP